MGPCVAAIVVLVPVQAFSGACEVPNQAQQLWPGIQAGPSVDYHRAQTFVVSRSGQLSRIEFLGARSYGDLFQDSLIVEIRNGLAGTVLAAATMPLADVPPERQWVGIDFPQAPGVTPGVLYALVLRTTGGACSWLGGNEDPYPFGFAYSRIPDGFWIRHGADLAYPDFTFRIYVCDPPTSVARRTWGAIKSLYRP